VRGVVEGGGQCQVAVVGVGGGAAGRDEPWGVGVCGSVAWCHQDCVRAIVPFVGDMQT
jgi:hypothetical protein